MFATSGELKKVRAMRDSLTVANGLVLINARLYVLRKLRQAALRRLHTDHQGIVRMTRIARDSV